MNDILRLSIEVISGNDFGKHFLVDDTCSLGTQDKCAIRLTDTAVAGLHARITLRGDSFTLTDLSDKNDLKVNNRLVKSMKLVPGDTIHVGNTLMKVSKYEDKPKEDGEGSPRTEIVVVREKPEDSFMETIERPERRVRHERDPSEERYARPVQPAREDFEPERIREREHEHAYREARPTEPRPTTVRPGQSEGPSISGQPMIDAMLRDARLSAARRAKSKFVGLIIFVLVVLAAGGLFIAYMVSVQSSAEKSFNEVVRYAESHPAELNKIIERYKNVREQYGSVSPKIRKYLDGEIVRLLDEVARQELALKSQLAQLDQRVADLVAKHAYEDALVVYRKSDEKYRVQVLDLRKSAIERLERDGSEYAEKVKKQQAEQDLQLKVENEKRAKLKLDRVLLETAQALIDADCDLAVKLLEDLVADPVYLPLKSQADEALTSAKLLASIDRVQALKALGAPVSSTQAVAAASNADVSLDPNLSPVVKAVLAIRNSELWEARAQLDKAKSHFLYTSLLERAKMSDEELKLEREAIKDFALIWGTVVGKPVTIIPRVGDCSTQWNELTKNMSSENVGKLSRELKAYQTKYAAMIFTRKYAELFGAVSVSAYTQATAKEPVTIEYKTSGLGEGKVIQAENNTFYVESDKDLVEVQGCEVGLFKDRTVFTMVGTNKAGAARIDVRAILPFRVLSNRQLSFVIPQGSKIDLPLMGERVLIQKDLAIGSRILSILPRPSPIKVFGDTFDEKLTDVWLHAVGAVKLDRGRLLIDRSSSVPDLVRKDDARADLQALLDISSDPVRVEFDMIRKADGGICIGIGDVEFLVGPVDGKKSGIYVKGVLTRPAVFMRPTTLVPQKVVVIRGQSFAYVAVGKNTAECRISTAAGESIAKRIIFSCDAKVSIDNVLVSKLPGSGAADVSAVSTDGKEFLFAKGFENEWDSVQRGQSVYVFGLSDSGESKQVATARVEGFLSTDRVLCSVVDGKVTGVKEAVWLVSDLPAAAIETKVVAVVHDNGQVQGPSTIYGIADIGKDGTFAVKADMREALLDGEGFFCVPKGLVIHPETGEKLATWLGKEIRGDFVPSAGLICCKPPAGYPVSEVAGNGVLLSRELLTGSEQRLDLAGKSVMSSVSALTTKHPYWMVLNGGWKEKTDGLASGFSVKPNVPPMIISSESFDGNVQYDLSLRVENEGKSPREGWIKDVMLQLDFAGSDKGVTFGINAEPGGGLSILGRSMGLRKERRKKVTAEDEILFTRFHEFGAETIVQSEKYADLKSPMLITGRNYEIKIRRVGDVVTAYANGKRLAYVRCPEFKGAVDLMVGAPGKTLSLGRISAQEVSASCITPMAEPLLGEFGYVLWSDASTILVDSSMSGLALNGQVSIVAVEKTVEGESSRTVFLKRIALGKVKELGLKTAIIQRTDSGEPVKKGMKVLLGTQPLQFRFTDSRLGSIDEGL